MSMKILYDVADTLQMELMLEKGRVSGEVVAPVKLGDLPMPFPLTVISSFLSDTGVALLLAGPGNFGLCFGYQTARGVYGLSVCDFSKFAYPPGDVFQVVKPTSLTEALNMVRRSFTRSYRKNRGAKTWEQVKVMNG